MKNKLILCLFVFLVIKTYSQDYMDVIAKQSCDCLDKVPDTLETDQFNMKLGLCMIEAANPYKKQIKKDYGINLDNIDTEGEKLGRIIGMKMATVCPNSLIKLTKKPSSKSEAKNEEKTAEGLITKIENDFFVVFSLKDDQGKTTKFYWLTFVDADLELTNKYHSLLGETAKITYKVQDFFDPKIEEYRSYNIISKVAIVRK